jgi:hypothetical protein
VLLKCPFARVPDGSVDSGLEEWFAENSGPLLTEWFERLAFNPWFGDFILAAKNRFVQDGRPREASVSAEDAIGCSYTTIN